MAAAVDRGLADGRTLGYYGALLSRLGRFDEATNVLKEATDVEPGRVQTHLELGRALEASGRFEEAAAAYGEAARLGPSRPEPLRALVRLFTTSLPDPARAGEAAERLRELEGEG
jgi:Flp pilus assembly protein TadD